MLLRLVQVCFLLTTGVSANSYELSLQKQIEKYQDKKTELENEMATVMKKEKERVVQKFEKTIVYYTKKGNLEKANEFLARKKEFIESSGESEKNREKVEGEEKPDKDWPFTIKSAKLIKNHKFGQGNAVSIKSIRSTEAGFVKGAKYKITGFVHLNSVSKATLFLGLKAKKKVKRYRGIGHSLDVKKGETEFSVERKFNADGVLHLSLYSEEGRLGRIFIE